MALCIRDLNLSQKQGRKLGIQRRKVFGMDSIVRCHSNVETLPEKKHSGAILSINIGHSFVESPGNPTHRKCKIGRKMLVIYINNA